MSAGEIVRVVVATANVGKVEEIRHALDIPGWEFLTVAELGGEPLEVEETGQTFTENALLKAHAYADRFGCGALADDSGLEVDALAGAPGVRSSRFSGEEATDAENNMKLLLMLAAVPEEERTARFRSVVVLIEPDGSVTVADGSCEGRIGTAPRGSRGFGYDPLFLPDAASGRTMAELALSEKNAISHRGAALGALREALLARM